MSVLEKRYLEMTKPELTLMLKPILKLLEQGEVETVKEINREVLDDTKK